MRFFEINVNFFFNLIRHSLYKTTCFKDKNNFRKSAVFISKAREGTLHSFSEWTVAFAAGQVPPRRHRGKKRCGGGLGVLKLAEETLEFVTEAAGFLRSRLHSWTGGVSKSVVAGSRVSAPVCHERSFGFG